MARPRAVRRAGGQQAAVFPRGVHEKGQQAAILPRSVHEKTAHLRFDSGGFVSCAIQKDGGCPPRKFRGEGGGN